MNINSESLNENLKNFIQNLIRSKDGYIILEGYYHKIDEEATLELLNKAYNGTEVITLEILKAFPVSDDQDKAYEEESDYIDKMIEKYERRLEGDY